MKTAEQVRPNYAPVYAAALYPELAKVFVSHGYALAVHGSLARDIDLIAIPWTEEISKPSKIIREISKRFAIKPIGRRTKRCHGRVAYLISIGFGECAIDLSFFPHL